MGALSALRLPPGWRLAALWSGDGPYGSRTRLVGVNHAPVQIRSTLPSAGMPPLPDALAMPRMSLLFRPGETPPRPRWVAWDVRPLLLDGGDALACFQRALLTRSADTLLSSGAALRD